MSTNIEWTDETDNIIVVLGPDGKPFGWWCRACSEGCDNCYAARLNQSDYFGGNHLPYTGPAPQLLLKREVLASWARQRQPRRHFVASMTDVFGEWLPEEWCFEFLDAMAAAPKQTFQVLTKRALRMGKIISEWLKERDRDRVPENIWLGVSVENQKWADIRIPDLLAIPATRFLSCEPLLGPLDLTEVEITGGQGDPLRYVNPLRTGKMHYGFVQGPIHWVIVGGESGHGAREFDLDWARSLVEQCRAAGVACFVKQLGENPIEQVSGMRPTSLGLIHDKKGGDMAEWPADLRVRQFPKVEVTA
jgi:protein gp37